MRQTEEPSHESRTEFWLLTFLCDFHSLFGNSSMFFCFCMPDECSFLEVVNVSSKLMGQTRCDVPSMWNDDILGDLGSRL